MVWSGAVVWCCCLALLFGAAADAAFWSCTSLVSLKGSTQLQFNYFANANVDSNTDPFYACGFVWRFRHALVAPVSQRVSKAVSRFAWQSELVQEAAKRLIALESPQCTPTQSLIVTNEAHRFLVMEQWRELDTTNEALLVLEPQGRNTAPAITMAALAASRDGSDPILVVSPADQVIGDNAAFGQSLTQAIGRASEGAIVVLGVTPTSD